MKDYISGMKFSVLFLLACGAAVQDGGAMGGLEAVVTRYA
jgi:hypothetical protein